MEFYKQLADPYDLMTRFEERFKNEKKILQKWQHKLPFQSALDVACGTGLHSILLVSTNGNPNSRN
jgi:ubiquinone/menaquinone biosynthesis C-methylase UbiE